MQVGQRDAVGNQQKDDDHHVYGEKIFYQSVG